jgi:hypothetical protein
MGRTNVIALHEQISTLLGNTIPAALQAQERILSSPPLCFYRGGDDAFLTGLSACLIGERKSRRREKRGKGSVLITSNNS